VHEHEDLDKNDNRHDKCFGVVTFSRPMNTKCYKMQLACIGLQ